MTQRHPARFLVLLLPLVILLPFAGQFPYPAYNAYSDLAITHYPNAVFLRDSILRFHQIPLWSPLILSGYPFAANPLSGLWYPPGWLALLFPLPLGFNLMVILHGLVAGAGMYRWLRIEGLNSLPSLLGAVTFQLLPRVFAHYASGHLTFTYAIGWTPWLLLAARRSFAAPRGSHYFLEAIVLALIGLADLRWLALAGLLWGAYRLNLLIRHCAAVLPWLGSAVAQGGIAGLLCAPVLLPLLEYTRLSTRAALTSAENTILSLPPARLFGLAAPSLDGNTEWMVYAGGVGLALALWAAGNPEIRRRTGFWLAVVAATLLLALGDSVPGVKFLYSIPGFDLLRVPSRFVLVAAFSLAVIAAHTAQYLSAEEHCGEKSAFWSRLLVAGLAGFTALAAFGVWLVTGIPPVNFLLGFGAISLAAALLFLRDRARLRASVWIGLLILLTGMDLLTVNALSVHFRPAEEVLAEERELAEYLDRQPGPFRVFSPSYSQPQQTAAVHHIEMANGIDPLQILTYAKYIENASGVPVDGYSVVLPPVTGDDLSHGNAGYVPDAKMLGLLNVRYLAVEDPISAPGFTFEGRYGSTYLYQNMFTLPRAWVQPEGAPAGRDGLPVGEIKIMPNEIQLVAAGPGRLVLSEISYPGWIAEVDGQPVRIDTLAALLRSISLPEGQHTVRFIFRPALVFAGLALAALGGILITSAALFGRRRAR